MTEQVFHEAAAEPRVQSVPLAHASLELGHLYLEDFAQGPDRLRRHFAVAARYADGLRARIAAQVPQGRPRISTCFLVDDYFARFSSPAELIPVLLAEAERAGLTIDYLGRESGCARADDVDIAAAVAARLVPSPTEGSDGSRPHVGETGWLCNGERTPAPDTVEAMSGLGRWRPPTETGARRHAIFMDVQLWEDTPQGRVWACPFLAAVWQLLRLGLLRNRGEVPMAPRPWTGGFPSDWDALPPLVRLNPAADPFAAYRTCTVLPSAFLPVEAAVRLILGQVQIEPEVLAQVRERAGREGVVPGDEVAAHVAHVFDPDL